MTSRIGRAPAALALASGLFVALYLYLLRDVGPANDEWTFLLYRPPNFHGILDEYNAQPVATEILLYRGWARLFGPDERLPLLAAYAAMHVGVAWLAFGLARRRVGEWAAAGAAVLILFLGRAWETILSPGSLTFVLPTLAACLAWYALDRPRRALLWTAGAALAVASLCGGLVLSILLGLAAEGIAARRRAVWWLVSAGAIPLAGWYAVKLATDPVVVGAGVPTVDLGGGLRELPLWPVKLLASAAGAVLGLPPAGGAVVLAVVVGALALAAWRGQLAVTPRAIGLAVTLGATLGATTLARAATTPPTTSRYLYFPAVVGLLLVIELARGLPRPSGRLAVGLGTAVVAGAAALGVAQMRDGKVFYRRSADGTAARMGAVRIAGDRLPPDFLIIEPSRLAYTRAEVDRFVARFGAGALHDRDELAGALPESRVAAAQILARAGIRPPR
ncbi:MAG: hypothetical protein QOJ97_1795 [Solirubrobacteraceae bacterium]|nr:hypothetical protein [Solirubrobacteraceae bacterium]